MRSPSRHSIRYRTGARSLATNLFLFLYERVLSITRTHEMQLRTVHVPSAPRGLCFKLRVRCDAGITSSCLSITCHYRWSFFSCRYGMFGTIAFKSCALRQLGQDCTNDKPDYPRCSTTAILMLQIHHYICQLRSCEAPCERTAMITDVLLHIPSLRQA
ncbi:hypothetical protein V8C43DRAFT_269073 [Trichoderma afarasin]